MRSKLKFLISSFVLGSLYSAYYFGIPAFVNLPQRVDFIQSKIKQESGITVKIENPKLKMGVLPAVILDADSVKVLNDDNSVPFDLQNSHLKLKILPLILKKIEISDFDADYIGLNLRMDKNLQLKLGQYNLDMQQKTMPLTLSKVKIDVKKYNIILNDEILKKDIVLRSKNEFKTSYIADNSLVISSSSELYSNKKPSEIEILANLKLPIMKIDSNKVYLKGSVKNLDLSDFSSYATYFSKGQITKLSGSVNFESDTKMVNSQKNIQSDLVLNNLGIYQIDKYKSIYFKDKLTVKSDISAVANGININEIKVFGKDIDIGLNGKIGKVNSKNPNYNINAILNKSRTEAFIPLLPGEEKLSPDLNLYLLKKNWFYGDVVGNMRISGSGITPDIDGSVLISNGYLMYPIPKAKGATIKLDFQKDILDLDVVVPTGNNQTVYVKGPIQLYKSKESDLHITSTDFVDLETAERVLNPLHEIVRFEIGPVPIMDIKGKGGIDLRVIGNKKNPHAFGDFHFTNATVSFNDIHNMVIKNASGGLTFKDLDTIFTTKAATLNGKPVSVNGICNLYGVLDFKVKTLGQDLGNLVKILATSPMLGDELAGMVKPVKYANGATDFYLNLTGKVLDSNDIQFGKNIFANGYVKLFGNTIQVVNSPAKLSNIKGKIDFDNLDVVLKLTSNLNKSFIFVDGKIKNLNADIKFKSDNLKIADVSGLLPKNIKLPYKNDINKISTSFSGKYHGSVSKINLNNVLLKGKVFSNKSKDTVFEVGNSTYELHNGNFKLSPLRGKIRDNSYYVVLNIKDLFGKYRNVNGQLDAKNLDLNIANDFLELVPNELFQVLKDCKNIKGTVDISSKIINNDIRAYTVLDNVSLDYVPKKMHFAIISGSAFLNGNQLNLNKLNTKLDSMPIFMNGKISNVFKNPDLNIYLNAKPSQNFIDQIFNNKQVYPLKMKGDINLTSRIKGTKDILSTNSVLNISDNSSLYYMGASIGDVENPVKLAVDADINGNNIKIRNFQYDKIITSQNNKPFVTPQLNASGGFVYLKNNIISFKNLKIKTQTPTDAKIFNIVFRKPIMKQGVFTSDIVLNGTSLNPKIVGKLDIASVDMPFYDSTIKDINLDMKHDKIYVKSKGLVLSNSVNLDAVLRNKLTPPFEIEDVNLKFSTLNIDEITDVLRDFEVESTQAPSSFGNNTSGVPDLSMFVVKQAKVLADKIKMKNIDATNFVSKSSLNEKMLLNIHNYKFDVAQGEVHGDANYNLLTHKVNLNMHMNNANSQLMSEALFDLKGQVYGLVTGDVNLVCNAKTHKRCMQTLAGDAYFVVNNGKMPKLGSLEYLLKAGNLLSGGVTGLSINGIIDLITPLKTGEFASISGDIHILNGIAQRINIYSDGKDLNMYMTGSYNLSNAIADMKIFGSLSKNMTSVFSKIKNASLNTLFNTIPWVNASDETASFQTEIAKIPSIKNQNSIYKIFLVDIYGDINGSNYVKSFKWVK